MIPLTTLQGLESQALLQKIAGRPVMIWGSGDLAQDVETSLRKSGASTSGTLHSKDPQLNDKLARKPFVVLATTTWSQQAKDILTRAGYMPHDYVTHLNIRRPVAVIEAVSDSGFINVDDFTRVVEKLNRDMPQLVRICLSWLGDPARHPQLQTLIAIAQKIAPVILSLHGTASPPYLMPYDRLLPGVLDNETKTAAKALPYDLDKALALAKSDAGLPCLSQRVFPIIGADLSVSVCHLYKPLILHKNYLLADWAQLLQIRSRNAHCETCQAKGLHRFDLDVLSRRHEGAI